MACLKRFRHMEGTASTLPPSNPGRDTEQQSSSGHTTPQQLPLPHLLIIYTALALTLFLATTDATILSTALPTIARELHANQTEYTWVVVVYLLTQTAFQPLNGKLSKRFGRKAVLFFGISVFMLGSGLCGGAQTISWLIAARAVAGFGGGAIVSQVWGMVKALVKRENYLTWSNALSFTWIASAAAGPLLGGVFSGASDASQSGTLSWRWGFYINIPICLFTLVVLYLMLKSLDDAKDFPGDGSNPFRRQPNALQELDVIGLVLFLLGISGVIIGFSFAPQFGWSSPTTISLVVIGILALFAGGFYDVYIPGHKFSCTEYFGKVKPIFPDFCLTDLSLIFLQAINFLIQIAFNSGTYYLAVYFQGVVGLTPFNAAKLILPYSLGSSFSSIPCNIYVGLKNKKHGGQNTDQNGKEHTDKSRKQDMKTLRYILGSGLVVSAVGFGAMIHLSENTRTWEQVLLSIIAGVGLGMALQTPSHLYNDRVEALVRNQSNININNNYHDEALGAFMLVRFTGATVSLAIAGLVFTSRASGGLPPGVDARELVNSFEMIANTNTADREQIRHAMAIALKWVWGVCMGCLVLAFGFVFLTNIARNEQNTDSIAMTAIRQSEKGTATIIRDSTVRPSRQHRGSASPSPRESRSSSPSHPQHTRSKSQNGN